MAFLALALLATIALGLPLTEQAQFHAQMAALYPGPRLIATSPTKREWMNYEQVLELAMSNVGFIDVTDEPENPIRAPAVARAFPTELTQQALFNRLLPYTSATRWAQTDQTLASYSTRHCNSATGVTAANWIADQFRAAANGRSDVTVSLEPTTGFQQPSVIAILEGTTTDEIIIYGGHEDSISSGSTAPGADDDASGTAAVLEIFYAFMDAGFKPRRTIHFITYSCEELGLIGSGQIARKYASQGINVYAVLQNDMIGYPGVPGAFGLITDYTDPELNQFVQLLTTGNYTELGFQNSRCNYGCSDHASWTNNGYPASFTFEAPFGSHSPYIHTTGDTFARIDTDHAYEILKLALGFLVELQA